jgi:signal peptidase I
MAGIIFNTCHIHIWQKVVNLMEEFEKNNVEEIPENNVTEIQDQEQKPEKFNLKKEIWEWVQAIVIALVVAFLLKNYVLTLAKVSGESMEPTLQHADRLYVNRVAYTPKKGDVVIFEPASAPGKPYIKRVIATEGDTIYIDFSKGEVYVNDELIEEPYISESTHLTGSYIEFLMLSGNYSRENPIKIKEGYFWAMGDNRNASKDSRELGQIPVDELIGHAVFRFWPLNNLGTVDFDIE